MTDSKEPTALPHCPKCKSSEIEYVSVLPFFAGEGCVWRCKNPDCKKKFIEKTGDNFLSSALNS